ncbi:MAG: hypothetical protein P8Z36_00830 [Gemmatimonadota bacterium]|jgi:hypothetical protein
MTRAWYHHGSARLLLTLLASISLASCATLREMAALRDVRFSLAGVSDGTLAGVPIRSANSFSDLSVLDAARVGAAFAGGHLPFDATLMVRADNPADNGRARLVALDWTLFLDGRKTVSGALDQEYVLPPGEPVNVPVHVQLDLLEFFDQQLQSVVNLALAAAGHGDPASIYLEATPSVRTPLGVVRYPEPVRIEYQVGGP